MRDFLNTTGWSSIELDRLIESGMRFKRGDEQSKPLAGRSVALVFFNPSLRTQASLQVGIYELCGNAVPNSFALAAAQMGHELVIAHPKGYGLDEELMNIVAREAAGAGGSVQVTSVMDEGFDGADVVYAKSWGSKHFYGAPEKDIAE